MVEYSRESGVCEQSFGVHGSSEQDWNHSIEGRMLLRSAVSEAQSDNTVHGKQHPVCKEHQRTNRTVETILPPGNQTLQWNTWFTAIFSSMIFPYRCQFSSGIPACHV